MNVTSAARLRPASRLEVKCLASVSNPMDPMARKSSENNEHGCRPRVHIGHAGVMHVLNPRNFMEDASNLFKFAECWLWMTEKSEKTSGDCFRRSEIGGEPASVLQPSQTLLPYRNSCDTLRHLEGVALSPAIVGKLEVIR